MSAWNSIDTLTPTLSLRERVIKAPWVQKESLLLCERVIEAP
jgi:predicted small integral membrane protein